jgi:hypothetical protein
MEHVMNKQADQVSHHNQHAKARHFSIEQNVMVRNKRPGKKWAPGVIKKQLGPLTLLYRHTLETLDHQSDNATSHTVTSTSTPVDVDQESFIPSIYHPMHLKTHWKLLLNTAPHNPDCVRNPPDRFI